MGHLKRAETATRPRPVQHRLRNLFSGGI
jgi:hypothetical protein